MAAEDRLERLDSILGTVNAGYEGHARMLAKAQLQEDAFIKKMAKLYDVTEREIKQKLDTIESEKKRQQYEELREKAIVEGFKKTLSGLQQFAGGAVSASQSVYNSDSAFTAVIPTLNLLGDTVKNITSALASFTSGIPILGALIGGVDKVTSIVVDMTTKVMSAQLENAQKMVNDYNAVSKAGMTFGADLTKLTEMSARAGMSMSTFTKFVTNNIESLSSFGGGIDRSADQIGRLAGNIAKENKALLTVYGSYEALASATADYGSLLAGYGIDVTRSNKMSQKAVEEYLMSQKELTAITGKSAATQKKEEEERRRHAAYQIRMAALESTNADAAANVRRNITLFGAVSKEAADFATEVFNTKGNVGSKEALMFQSQFPELAETIRKTQSDAITQNAADFRKNQAAYLSDRAPLLKQEAEKFGSTYELSAIGVKNSMLDLRDSVGSGTIAAFSKLNDIIAQVNIQEGNRKTLLEQNNIKDEKGNKVGPIVGQVIESLETFKIKMDEMTSKTLPQIGNITKSLLGIQTTMVERFGTPDMINSAVEKFAKVIEQLLGTPRPDGRTNAHVAAGHGAAAPGVSTTGEVDISGQQLVATRENTQALRDNNTSLGSWLTNLMQRNEEGRPGGAPVTSGSLTPNDGRRHSLALNPPTPPAPTGPTSPAAPAKLKAPTKANAGTLNQSTVDALNAIYARFGDQGMEVTSGNDKFHKNRKSVHNTGNAADVKFRKGSADYETLETAVKRLLKEQGIDAKVETHFDEDAHGNKSKTKKHMHIEVPAAQKKAEAAADDQNTLLSRLVEIFEDHLAVAEESRDTLDVLKRQMA